jgi:hypothetical protein
MLELIDRVNLEPDATYEDYCEVVDALLCVDPEKWPDPSSVLEVPAGKLTYEIEQDFDFAEEILEEDEVIEEEPSAPKPDPISEKMELFMKKIISSVYLDGVTNVTDMDGNPPNSANNYLLSEDGKQFRGVFYDAPGNSKPKQFPFVISENESGKWIIKY